MAETDFKGDLQAANCDVSESTIYWRFKEFQTIVGSDLTAEADSYRGVTTVRILHACRAPRLLSN